MSDRICKRCLKQFADNFKFNRHINRKHPCELVNGENNEELQKNILSKSNIIRVCGQCLREFSNSTNYNLHVNRKNPCINKMKLMNIDPTILADNFTIVLDPKNKETQQMDWTQFRSLDDIEHLGPSKVRTFNHLLLTSIQKDFNYSEYLPDGVKIVKEDLKSKIIIVKLQVYRQNILLANMKPKLTYDFDRTNISLELKVCCLPELLTDENKTMIDELSKDWTEHNNGLINEYVTYKITETMYSLFIEPDQHYSNCKLTRKLTALENAALTEKILGELTELFNPSKNSKVDDSTITTILQPYFTIYNLQHLRYDYNQMKTTISNILKEAGN
jgi:hypothetical protein